MTWQPISTAPTNTPVLCYLDDYAVGIGLRFGRQVYWFEYLQGNHDIQPTHWMPLPSPPESA